MRLLILNSLSKRKKNHNTLSHCSSRSCSKELSSIWPP